MELSTMTSDAKCLDLTREIPGASTPWARVNQLLSADERFSFQFNSDRQGYLLAPKQPSRLAALFYFLQQENIPFCIQGRGSHTFVTEQDVLFISSRAFTEIRLGSEGIVEVGAGCPLSQLHQFLFEHNQEVSLEENPLGYLSKRSVGGLILSGLTSSLFYREEFFLQTLLGLEIVTSEGAQLVWGGRHRGSAPGPALHKLMYGLETLPGMITKVVLKTYPIPHKRLRLAWTFRQKEPLWERFYALKNFSNSWEYLEVVQSGDSASQGFVFAQISGLPEEMEAFSLVCPGYIEVSQGGERATISRFLSEQKLNAYCVDKDYSLEKDDYLWLQSGKSTQHAWLFTKRMLKGDREDSIWKERFFNAFKTTENRERSYGRKTTK